jgi:hypothetical protein
MAAPARRGDRRYRRAPGPPHPLVSAEALDASITSVALLAKLFGDEDPRRRRAACRAWESLDPQTRALLRADPDETFLRWGSVVSAALQNHPNFPRGELARRFADDPDAHKRWLIYQDPDAPADAVLRLSHDPDISVRRRGRSGQPRVRRRAMYSVKASKRAKSALVPVHSSRASITCGSPTQ